MITMMSLRAYAVVFVLGATVFCSNKAAALTMRTDVAPIYQVGNGATVNLGHTVYAQTNYNRLYAGGSYVATCAAPQMLPTNGQRFLSAEALVGGNTLYVTIPRVHPARVNMPGFNAAELRGRRLDCTYSWISRAVEGQFSVGPGGVGFVSGGAEMSEGGTQLFVMDVPGLADEDEWTSCIP